MLLVGLLRMENSHSICLGKWKRRKSNLWVFAKKSAVSVFHQQFVVSEMRVWTTFVHLATLLTGLCVAVTGSSWFCSLWVVKHSLIRLHGKSKVVANGEVKVTPVRPQFIRTAWSCTRLYYSLWSLLSPQVNVGYLDGMFQRLALNTASASRWYCNQVVFCCEFHCLLLPSLSQGTLVTACMCCGTALRSPGDDFAFLHSLGQLHIWNCMLFAVLVKLLLEGAGTSLNRGSDD